MFDTERFRRERATMRGRKTITTTTTKRTIGYVRVSTEDQSEAGVSLAAQVARIRAFAVATARELDEVVVDAGVSAKSLQRPGMARIIEGVKRGEVGVVMQTKGKSVIGRTPAAAFAARSITRPTTASEPRSVAAA